MRISKKAVALMTTILMAASMGASVNAKTIINSYGEKMKVKEELTDIGNNIQLYSREIGRGHATVVFDGGYGDGIGTNIMGEERIDNWAGVQDKVAEYTRTLSYDRTGIGKSSDVGNMNSLTEDVKNNVINGGVFEYNENDFVGLTKTPRDRAINLHNLLKAKNISAPYILASHSLGGFTTIEFAKMYGNELAGIVFLDATSRNAIGDALDWYSKNMPELVDIFLNQQFSKVDGTLDEVLMGQVQVKNDKNALRDIPLLYLASYADIGNGWLEMRGKQTADILSLSDESELKIVPNAGHYVHIENPEFVSKAIKEFVYKVEYNK